MKLFLLLILVGCGSAPRRAPISPDKQPFTLARMRASDERAVFAPMGTQVQWSGDGAAILVDGGIGRISIVAQKTRGLNVNERDIRRLFARSLEQPDGPLMVEQSPGVTIYCQRSAEMTSRGPALRFAACVRIDDATRKDGILTLAVFGSLAEHFDRLGGARLCAEVLRSARGFK